MAGGTTAEAARALLAVGLNNTVIVIATDSLWLAMETEQISDSADDLGIDTLDLAGHSGIWLWEGRLSNDVRYSGDTYEPETSYDGMLRVPSFGELPDLLMMTPPEDPNDELPDVQRDDAEGV